MAGAFAVDSDVSEIIEPSFQPAVAGQPVASQHIEPAAGTEAQRRRNEKRCRRYRQHDESGGWQTRPHQAEADGLHHYRQRASAAYSTQVEVQIADSMLARERHE